LLALSSFTDFVVVRITWIGITWIQCAGALVGREVKASIGITSTVATAADFMVIQVAGIRVAKISGAGATVIRQMKSRVSIAQTDEIRTNLVIAVIASATDIAATIRTALFTATVGNADADSISALQAEIFATGNPVG
jgi:hypothetical protein